MTRCSVLQRAVLALLLVLPALLIAGIAGASPADEFDGPAVVPPNDLVMPQVSTFSPNTVSFRTDAHPELDFYQPCNGGDNSIVFPINVHDVDIGSIGFATLTLAVWDVDYDCGGACSGLCERDPVSINGHLLTTPTAYLTGANGLWSTCTFNVDPDWIVEGDNVIFIDIDTLSRSCWCVTCDWGELSLTMGNPPEIDEIVITPDDPMTEHDVTFEAVITEAEGFEVLSVDWSVTDVESGSVDFFTTDENPYTTQPPRDTHGQKEVACTVTYENLDTGATGLLQETMAFTLFFEKEALSDPTNPASEPNWFVFWKSDAAVPNMGPAHYDGAAGGYGYATGHDIYLCKKASGQHYISAITFDTFFGTESFGGPDVKGIDCAAEVIAHENYHVWVTDQWAAGGSFNGQTDSDYHLQAADCNDRLPDFYEDNTSHTANDDTDTYDLETLKAADYRRYGDEEYMAMRTGDNARGTAADDWANPGKQTTTPYKSLEPAGAGFMVVGTELPAALGFTGSFTDEGRDTNANGYFEYLNIAADVDATAEDTYDIVGVLKSGGTMVGLANISVALPVGTSRVDLRFSGFPLNQIALDGPFSLDLQLADEEGMMIENLVDAYQTGPYSHTQFEGEQASVAGDYLDEAVDGNGDGAADFLRIRLGVGLEVMGDYRIGGYLADDTGHVIAFAYADLVGSSGTQQVDLDFPGLAIAINGRDAPYDLVNLRVVDLATGLLMDYLPQAYTVVGYTAGQFRQPTAAFNGVFADNGLDTNGDGRYEKLLIDVGLDVVTGGSYILIGGLYDGAGAKIANATTEAVLTAGAGTMQLRFEGPEIYLHGVDGPYYLKHTKLYGENGSLVWLDGDAWTTAAYAYTSFNRGLVELTGEYSDSGLDTNGDGLYEQLRLTVGIIVANAGNYGMSARLLDSDGVEIVWAGATRYLPADTPQTMNLDFNGTYISANGVNGPYDVRDVYVYNTASPSLADYDLEPFSTAPYNYWDFAGPKPPMAVAGGPYEGAVNVPVVLDASGSWDPDGTVVWYDWDWDADGDFDERTADPVIEHTWATMYDGPVVLLVTDDSGLTGDDQTTVTMANLDVTPPEILVTASPGALWPPNHKLVPIEFTVFVTDDCDSMPHWELVDILCNEPDDGTGDGDTAEDIQEAEFGAPDTMVKLRAERAGTGNGRTYRAVFRAYDATGNEAIAYASVVVPHSNSGTGTVLGNGNYLHSTADQIAFMVPGRSLWGKKTPVRLTAGDANLGGDAGRSLDPLWATLGNTAGVVQPLVYFLRDVDQDGYNDVLTSFDRLDLLMLQSLSDEEDGAPVMALELAEKQFIILDIADAQEAGFDLNKMISDLKEEDGIADPTVAAGTTGELPGVARLTGVAPNPFNPSTTISFFIPVDQRVELTIFDITGRQVVRLLDQGMTSGDHAVVWRGVDDRGGRVASGVYFLRLTTGSVVETARVVMIK